MTQPIVKSLIDEQPEEVKAKVRGTIQYPASMRVIDLKEPIKADWLKRRPVERRT